MYHCYFEPIAESEVYDPKEDTWSSIEPLRYPRCDQRVTAMGEELIVHDGKYLRNDWKARAGVWASYFDEAEDEDDLKVALFLEAYHPVKDERRVVERFRPTFSVGMFYAHVPVEHWLGRLSRAATY
ncbi:unnamed protein product [Calypogeia fissa]